MPTYDHPIPIMKQVCMDTPCLSWPHAKRSSRDLKAYPGTEATSGKLRTYKLIKGDDLDLPRIWEYQQQDSENLYPLNYKQKWEGLPNTMTSIFVCIVTAKMNSISSLICHTNHWVKSLDHYKSLNLSFLTNGDPSSQPMANYLYIFSLSQHLNSDMYKNVNL